MRARSEARTGMSVPFRERNPVPIGAIGIAVIGGVVAGTVLGILFVPIFYVVIARKDPPRRSEPEPAELVVTAS